MAEDVDFVGRYFIVTTPYRQGRIIGTMGASVMVDLLSDAGEVQYSQLEPVETPDYWFSATANYKIEGRKATEWHFYPDKESWLKEIQQRREKELQAAARRERYDLEQAERRERRRLWWRSLFGLTA